ncbi:MAG: flagellar hook-basal body complex protein FliE [Phycisphaerales bacterium]
MSDPLGLISGAARSNPQNLQGLQGQPKGNASGPNFKSVLMENLNQVNSLQADAGKAAEDLMTGKRDDVEGVIAATQKAETAFKMLQAMRNQVMQAYDEIKQMRV